MEVVGGISSLLTIGVILKDIIAAGNQYRKAFQNAPESLRRLYDEAEALDIFFEQYCQREDQPGILKRVAWRTDVLESFAHKLGEIHSYIQQYGENSSKPSSKLKFALRHKRIEDALDTIRRLQFLLDSAVRLDDSAGSRAMRKQMKNMERYMQRGFHQFFIVYSKQNDLVRRSMERAAAQSHDPRPDISRVTTSESRICQSPPRHCTQTMTSSPSTSYRPPRPSQFSETQIFDLSFGRIVLRRSGPDSSSPHRRSRKQTRAHALALEFMPSKGFFQTIVRLHVEWTASLHAISLPHASLHFSDIVPEDHEIMQISRRGDAVTLKQLLSTGAVSPSSCTTAGWTPLHFAAAKGHVEVCQLLVDENASLHATGLRGVTPLHVAAHFGHMDVFKRLLEAGSDPDVFHENGENAVFELMRSQRGWLGTDHWLFLNWLLHGQQQYLIDIHAKDNDDCTVLSYLSVETRSELEMSNLAWIDHKSEDRRINSEENESLDDQCELKCTSEELESSSDQYASEGSNALETEYGEESSVDSNSDGFAEHDIYPVQEPDGFGLENDLCRNIRVLIEAGARPDEFDARGSTVLHRACQSGKSAMVTELLKRPCNVNVRDNWGFTPLHWAVFNGHLRLASKLIRSEADVLAKTANLEVTRFNLFKSTIPLTLAAHKDDVAMFRMLLQHGAGGIDADLNEAFHNAVSVRANKIIRWLTGNVLERLDLDGSIARAGNPETVRLLHRAGASLDDTNFLGRTALHVAVFQNDKTRVDLLLDLGADINVLSGPYPQDGRSVTPLGLAAIEGYQEMVTKLLDRGADALLTGDCEPSPLQLATGSGNSDVAEIIARHIWASDRLPERNDVRLISKAYLDKLQEKETDALDLFSAVSDGDLDLVKQLVSAGCSINSSKRTNESPLCLAIGYRRWEIAQFLIEAGANLNTETEISTSLRTAVVRGNTDIVRLLINKGADAARPDNDLLHLNLDNFKYLPSQFCRHADIVRILVEAGADVGLVDKFGRTPLGMAVQVGNFEASKVLVDAGADLHQVCPLIKNTHPSALDGPYQTPLTWAALNRHEEIVGLLFEAGASWKDLKKDPTLRYIHRILMRSTWFPDEPESSPLKVPPLDILDDAPSQKRGKNLQACETPKVVLPNDVKSKEVKVQRQSAPGDTCPPPSLLDKLVSRRVQRHITTLFASSVRCAQHLWSLIQRVRLEVAVFLGVSTLLLLNKGWRLVSQRGMPNVKLVALAALLGFLASEMSGRDRRNQPGYE